MANKQDGASGPGTVERLATWVLAQRADDMQTATIEQAKLLVLDTIGCGFAAIEEESARAVLQTVAATGGAAQCMVIGGAQKTSAPNAVLANGALIRILDLNDYVNNRSGQIGGHPSDNIPVALAAGELANASGRDVLAAIIIGYEVFGRFKDLIDRDSDWDGVTVSGLVAPAMAGRLMGLDAQTLGHALALSIARSPTPLAVRHGDISAAKSLANALIAQNGMQATLLAQHGATGPLDIFENPHGVRTVFSKTDGLAAALSPLTDDATIMRAHIKAYPCLATGQAIVAAALDLHRQLGGDVGRLTHIKVAMADRPFLRRQKDDPGRIDPASREAADHSFNFLGAVALLDGEFGLAQFENERWNDPKVRAVMARLEIVCDPAWNERAPGSFPCSIRARRDDGREFIAEVPDPPGFSRHGIDAKAVIDKFHAVTAPQLSRQSRDRIVEAVLRLERSPSCEGLTAALASASKT